ncbi:MAG: hypothetical protein BWK73_26750 [Thiothrix lacustris]|uniref:CI repressor n=1 Tax=Thiothrix lacustris TaxID=525917 RepID=A0A1Y1QKI2_9GAMM|nr:MAG: hypothetical protein BWK73_26750 [Thiothrix lacustris]
MDTIEYLGGTSATARFFRVSPQVVNNWRNRHGGLPKSWQIVAIEKGIPPHIVRPDLFKADESSPSQVISDGEPVEVKRLDRPHQPRLLLGRDGDQMQEGVGL